MRSNVVLVVLATSLLACSASNDKDGSTALVKADGGGDGGTGLDLDADPSGGLDADPTTIDPAKDNDGDGFLFADDCNDTNKDVNPGAFDVPGDKVDNDCNGKVDDVDDCDTAALKYDSGNAMDLAKAMGLCRTSTGKSWGVVKAELVRADGSGSVGALQHGILKKFGGNIGPRSGANFAVLSSGTARTPDYPGWQEPLNDSYDSSNEVSAPAGWPKNSPGCPDPGDKLANDSVNLKLTIKVPTNAHGFSYALDFYSSEYIEYVCSTFNDSFVALLDTKAMLDPKNAGNISFDAKGSPINVNSGFFEVCKGGTATGGKSFACAKGTKELEGTGFWPASDPFIGQPTNGATGWLETKAPVVPGETITLEFMIWDTGDHILDSTVLLDDFKWDAMGTTAPVTDRPK
jgi:hypothetical protein